MNKKLFFCLFTLLIFCGAAKSQFFQLTSTTGTQTVGGNSVTVTQTGIVNNINYCGTSPYYLTQPGSSYNYSFASPVSSLRLQFAAINNGETIAIYINGTQYILTAANLSPYSGNCGMLNVSSATAQGYLTTVSGAPSGVSAGQQVDIDMCGINTVSVQFVSGNIGGVVYNMLFSSVFGGSSATTASSDTPCVGQPLHLYCPIPGGTYSWTGPNNFSSNLQNPVINNAQLVNAGTYILNGSNGQCSFTDTIEVVIRPKPATPSVSSNSPLCLTETLSLFATAPGAVTYNWYGPNGFTSPIPNPQIANVTNAEAGLYSFYISAANGCISDTTSLQVNIHPEVIANFSYQVHYGCDEDTVIFSNQTNIGVKYRWFFGDGTTDTVANPVHIYKTQNMFNIQLKSYSLFCEDSVDQNIDLVHPIAASFTVSKDTICQNEQVSFTNTSQVTTRNNISPSYVWHFGDGQTDNTTDATHSFTSAGQFPVMLIAKDFVPCMDTAIVLITVDSTPFLDIYASTDEICEGQGIYFDADYVRGGLSSLVWDFADGGIVIGNANTTHGFDRTGVFDVSLTATYRACPEITVSKSIRVKEFPHVDLGIDTAICPGDGPISLSDYYNASNGMATWVWNTGEQTSSIKVSTPAVYAATVTIDGCSTTDSVTVRKGCYIDIPNAFTPDGDGVNEYFFPRDLLSHALKTFTMSIYNRWGQKIFETQALDGRGWDGRFNGSVQPAGVYVYMIDVVFRNEKREYYQGNITLLR